MFSSSLHFLIFLFYKQTLSIIKFIQVLSYYFSSSLLTSTMFLNYKFLINCKLYHLYTLTFHHIRIPLLNYLILLLSCIMLKISSTSHSNSYLPHLHLHFHLQLNLYYQTLYNNSYFPSSFSYLIISFYPITSYSF